jgi:hypothetical protein
MNWFETESCLQLESQNDLGYLTGEHSASDYEGQISAPGYWNSALDGESADTG